MRKISLLCSSLLVVALFAAGCSSSSDSALDTDDGSTSVPSTDSRSDDTSDGPVADGPANPESIRQTAGSLTGADIGGEGLTCLVEHADGDSQLTAAYNGIGTPGYQLTPEAFTALAVSVHGCISHDVLNASLLTLSGAADAAAITQFTDCLDTQLDAEQTGDLAYTGLAALSVGFPVPEGAQDSTIVASRACVGAESLANQLAGDAENATAYTTTVDRECLSSSFDATFLDSFWEDVITNTGPTEGLEDLLSSCSSPYDSGLPKEVPADFVPWSGTGALSGIDPESRNGLYDTAPPALLVDGVDYQAILTTADGEILIDLFEDTAPATVNAFVALARDGYYDATVFHRVLDGFMAQAGDPTGTGVGGPGYSFEDEESGLTPIDRAGLLAMANSGPDTNGSQFFITFAAATHLDGLHTVFGEVIDGDAVLQAVERRDPQAPTSRGEVLQSITIIEK